MKHTNQYNMIIGIDPDVTKSGVALLDCNTKHLKLDSLTFPQLLDYLERAKNYQDKGKGSIIVVVEASWLIRGNWHLSSWERKQRAAAKGYDVGRNHETGRKIVEMCNHIGLEVLEHAPLRKIWEGSNGKITHEELKAFTNITGRTNQDERDAALLAWSVAGFPIKLIPKK